MNKEKLNCLIEDITNEPQSLINISHDDVSTLFHTDAEIHSIDASVSASANGRMKQLMEQVRKNVTVSGDDIHLLFYLFFPENLPLMMNELFQFTKWIDMIPARYTIKLGLAKHNQQELRTVILWQSDYDK